MSNRSSHHIIFCVVCTCMFPLFAIASLCDGSKKFLSSFTPSISSVAHRGYKIHGAVENTAEAYRYAREAGFQYGETDIQWTKDNIPVCCHDKFFIDNTTKDSITIEQYTLDELRCFNYKGTTISTLEEVMDTCKKHGLGLYLDRLTPLEGERKQTLCGLIDNFGKENVCYLFGWYQRAGIQQVLEYDPNAQIGILYFKKIDTALVEFANSISTPSNKVFLDLEHASNPIDTLEKYIPLLNENISLGFFTINNKNTYMRYLPYATSITSDQISEEMLYVSGINNISSDNVVRTEYYSIDGKKINQPTKGIVIRRQILSDDRVITDKVIL